MNISSFKTCTFFDNLNKKIFLQNINPITQKTRLFQLNSESHQFYKNKISFI